jgi:hypothetical protein
MLLQGISLQAAITIRIEASFGAKKKDCRGGLGICSAKTVRAENPGAARQVTLALSDDETTLLMVIDRRTLEEAEGQIAAGRFIQDEDFIMPAEVSLALAIAGTLKISAGDYEARQGGQTVTVRIPLSGNSLGFR